MAVTIEDHPQQPSQPQSGDVVSLFSNALAQAPAETPQAPETLVSADSTTPPPAPATLAIPVDRVPEKFRKNPEELASAYENAERAMHQRANEAAQLRRELDEERQRRITSEQLAKLQTQPAQRQPDVWEQAGVKPEEAVITDTRRFVDTTAYIAAESARAAAEEAARRVVQESESKQQSRNQASALIGAFEEAKKLARDQGYQFSDEEWRDQIGYIAPRVVRDADNAKNPTAIYDPKQYLTHFQKLRGPAPKPGIPSEANPPVANRASAVNPAADVKPTLSREQRQVREQMASVFVQRGLMTKDQAKAYTEGQ